jgi:small subunit ribosomal protein S16
MISCPAFSEADGIRQYSGATLGGALILTKGATVAVRIRMKMMGRKHRPFFRIVAIDSRQPRDGRILEELGTYDPMMKDKENRVILKPERIKYWQSVGAKVSEKVTVLFGKYMKKFEEAAKQTAAAPPVESAPAS